MSTTAPDWHARCCVVGGGPAGMMLGLLLARAGVAVTVLEKHADFLRDFRGDTVHPSTRQILCEIGLAATFDKLPQRKIDHFVGLIGKRQQELVDFRGLKPFAQMALVPQWDLLDMLADAARGFPTFDLRMCHKATGLIEAAGRTVGVRVTGPGGAYELRAELVVACDGRHSTVREAAGLKAREFGAPMDVLWFRIPRRDSDMQNIFGIIDGGHMMVLLDRDAYWQAAFLVPKGSDERLRSRPIEGFRESVARLAPFLADRTDTIRSWNQVKTLSVQVDRLESWHKPGLLLIGDAAHAMSPIGGVGINLAIQDAVAAANVLARPLCASGAIDEPLLAQIQRRRQLPTRIVQKVQMVMQKRVISRALEQGDRPAHVSWWLRFLLGFRAVRHIPARLFGYGIRQEHVRTP